MRYLKYLSALLIIALMLFQVTAAAYEGNGGSTSYTYDENGNDVSIPDAYTFKKSVDITDSEGVRASDPHGLVVSEETGKTYVVDTGNNRILVFSNDFSYEKALSEFKNGGETLQLNQPEGMFVYKNGDLLIADTQNNRIIKCNADGNVKQVIERPENMTGVSDSEVFLPVKLAVDSIGRIYVVARNINRGIIQLDSQGKFMGYIGSPQVQYDIMTIILRRFYTEAQQAKSEQFVPTEYNNICMDGEDFLWATISSLDAEDIENTIKSKDKSGSVTPVKKLNTMGTDVLKRNGFYAPMGDLEFDEEPSRIIGVSTSDNGVYSMLDQQNGHVFTYDDNGNLLFVFGKLGNEKSSFQTPADIRYKGDQILVLDSGLGKIFVFSPSSYGELVLEAVASQYNGDYEEAYGLWSQLASQNTNFKYAFVGLGNAMLEQGEYDAALKYFKYAEDTERYSDTVEIIRKQNVQKYFPAIMVTVIVIAVVILLYHIIRRFVRYYKGS